MAMMPETRANHTWELALPKSVSPSGIVLPGTAEPKLVVPWGDFHQGKWSCLAALLTGPSATKDFLSGSVFRDSWVERRIPTRAVFAAALWHVAFLLAPFSLLPGLPHTNPAFQNTELTWSGPINDLPLLDIPKQQPATEKPKVERPAIPQPPREADAFHPRQRIFTDPVHPTHPRQTLINPAAPALAPKLLPKLPNMVQFQQAAPSEPRPQIREDMLKNLHPREPATTTSTSLTQAPNLDQHVAELNLPSIQSGPARPKLELNGGAAPRLAQKAQPGDAGPAPDVAASHLTAANGSPAALIALSASPAPPAPVAPPQGNLAAKVSVSPEAKPGAAPSSSGSRTAATGGNPIGVSISGGDPPASSNTSSTGGATKPAAPAPRLLITRPEPKPESDDTAERTGPPDFASLPPGSKPEVIFASKTMYTMNVNMPNVTSATGSWILNFSELHSDRPHMTPTDLSGPVPLKKVDPKYPPTLVADRVQGEVVLYAVIRKDGSVDSIQLVRSVDEQLDANAISALRQWKFRPAQKAGSPIDLEAIVHIPFRLPEFP